MSDAPRRILIRSTNWIGDAVMTLPAIKEVRRLFPQAQIDLLARPWVAEMFTHASCVDRVVVFDKAGPDKGLGGMRRFARERLKPEGYDLALILPNSFSSGLLIWLAGIKRRVGYPTSGRGLLLTDRGNDTTDGLHQTRRYLHLLTSTGLSEVDYLDPDYLPDVSLPLDLDLAQEAARLLEPHGVTRDSAPLLGINPGAYFGPAKRWFPDRYAGVAEQLIERHGATVLLFGAPGDVPLSAEIVQNMRGPVIDFTGKTSLVELLALMARCDLLLTNDSGPMHLAAALRRPLIALFGSTDEVATGPASELAVVIHKHVDCSPCLQRECPIVDLHCFTEISVDEVVAAADRILVSSA